MAAIKPHLAQDEESTEQQRAYWRCSENGNGFSGLGEGEVCPAPQQVVQEAHAGLMNTAWIREALVRRMQGRKIWIAYDKKDEPTIAIDWPPPKGPAWNPSGGAKRTTILGWTTKMGAPSFSLPAGCPAMGGACPGASGGQTTAPPTTRIRQVETLLPILNQYQGGRQLPEVERVDPTKTICEFCYAEGGQYSTSGVQNAQLMRFAWARRAIKRPGHQPGVSEFYSVMLDAIDNADFKHGKEPKQYGKRRFFRLHDSGDFFDPDYLAAWKQITLYYHPLFGGDKLVFGEGARGEVVVEKAGTGHTKPIYFWAPTRVWAQGQSWVDRVHHVNGFELKGKPTWDNFSIRPSAYQINQAGPFIDLSGWAAPTTVFENEAKEKPGALGVAYDWDCRAYAVEKGPSCRGANSNPEGQGKGKEGCRDCWLNQDKAVNYTLHL
jgi:hypothetical protein